MMVVILGSLNTFVHRTEQFRLRPCEFEVKSCFKKSRYPMLWILLVIIQTTRAFLHLVTL